MMMLRNEKTKYVLNKNLCYKIEHLVHLMETFLKKNKKKIEK